MTDRSDPRPSSWPRSRIGAVALSAIVVAILVAANAHLIAVSFSSQPDCVPHLKAPAEGAAQFRAAMSSC